MHFFRNETERCPVTAMNAYLTGKAAPSSTDPLFRDDKGRRLTQGGVVERLRELLRRADQKGAEFSGISLRRGGAQTLLRLGATDKVLVAMGRWKSDCFRRYLTIEDQDRRQWQRQMAHATD